MCCWPYTDLYLEDEEPKKDEKVGWIYDPRTGYKYLTNVSMSIFIVVNFFFVPFCMHSAGGRLAMTILPFAFKRSVHLQSSPSTTTTRKSVSTWNNQLYICDNIKFDLEVSVDVLRFRRRSAKLPFFHSFT